MQNHHFTLKWRQGHKNPFIKMDPLVGFVYSSISSTISSAACNRKEELVWIPKHLGERDAMVDGSVADFLLSSFLSRTSRLPLT